MSSSVVVRLVEISLACALVAALSACSRPRESSGDAPSDPGAVGSAVPEVPGKKCVVHLHGKSGRGAAISVEGDVTHLRPSGNANGWGGKQWLYFPESGYQEVRRIVSGAMASAGCSKAVVHGFSNGAAAAAKLYCRGERFEGRVAGYVVDDPVPDHAVEGCKPASGVAVRLYWTSALTTARDGWSCSEGDWTCEGDRTIGIEKYARALGAEAAPSVNRKHEEHATPPEYAAWLSP